MSVSPYWELTFDADGDTDVRKLDRLFAEVKPREVRDLIVFAHGWNNDRSIAAKLYNAFFDHVHESAPATAKIGYVGVVWPSMRFTDEPIPDFARSLTAVAAAEAAGGAGLDKDTRHALLEVFPERATVVEQIGRLLDQQPAEDGALEEFGGLVRLLVEVPPEAPQAAFAADLFQDGEADGGRAVDGAPVMFAGSTAAVCEEFAVALAGHESPGPVTGFALPNPWKGAKELLRQATYYAMKRRAGTVGERGLGPVLGRLAEAAPGVRVHLVGHSFGGRLVSFALRGLPEGVRTVKSVTLLQGAFSHYAFAARLPHDAGAGGALRDRQSRIDGPLVCCYSHHDGALRTFYPLASRMARDSHGIIADQPLTGVNVAKMLGPKWGAMGHDGVQAVPDTVKLTITEAVESARFPASGCVNIDAAAVVKKGDGPAGAHSDICHKELAQVVLAAGRIK